MTMLEKMAEAIRKQEYSDDDSCEALARAALMAMREPSEEMTAVGMTGVMRRSSRVTWVLMIDAILADAPPCPSAPGSVE